MAKPGKKNINKEQLQAPKTTAPVQQKEITNVSDLFDKLGNKTWLAALGIIFVIAFLVFKDYLLFDKVYLFKDIGSDTMNGLYPYIYYTAGEVANHHFPVWSYSWGMGQNIFPQLFRDPFDIFLFYSGKDHIAYGIIYKELAKILCGGMLFFFYLRTMKMSNFTSLVGSMLFSFCAFMIVGGGWSFFSFEAFSTALLLLSFELMFMKKQWYLFPVAIFVICMSTPVNLYLYGLFLAIYAVARCYQEGVTDLKGMGGLFLKMIGFGLIGVLICAPFIIPNILMILESPRGSGSSSYAHILASAPLSGLEQPGYYIANLGTCVMRFFASDLLGSGNDFKGVQNILEAPMFYCGIPCLLLMPQVFGFLSKKARIAFVVILGLWLLPVIFPYFRYAFWLFTGDYYRAYSFFVSMIFLFYSLQALELVMQKKKLNLVVLIVTVVLLFILINYPFFPDKDFLNTGVYGFVCLMLVVYAALLFFMAKPGSPAYMRYIFVGAIFVELVFLSSTSVNQRDSVTAAELSQRIGYNDYSKDALNVIKKTDNTFYRVDKNYASSPAMHYSLNDAMVQGYYGTSSYNSFNEGSYVNYLQLMGLVDKNDELQTRWASGLISRPILESENRVKYILARAQINPLWNIACDTLGTYGDVKLFRNKFVLPMGFTYNTYIKESVFAALSNTQKDFSSLKTCVVADADVSKVQGLKEFQLKDTIPAGAFNLDVYRQLVNDLAKDSLALSRLDNEVISGKVDVAEDKVMYLSLPFDAGWILKDNGQVTDKIKLSAGMTGIVLKKGHHDIELSYHERYRSAGWMASLAGLVLFGSGLFLFRRKS